MRKRSNLRIDCDLSGVDWRLVRTEVKLISESGLNVSKSFLLATLMISHAMLVMLLRFQYGLKDMFTVMEKFGLTSMTISMKLCAIIVISNYSLSLGYDQHDDFSVSSVVWFDPTSYHLQGDGRRALRFCRAVWSISDTPQQKH